MTRLFIPLASIVGWMLASAAMGDVVRLKDGSSVEGEIKRAGDAYLVTAADGKITRVPAETVAGIDVKPVNSADAAMSRLQSLRHAAENMTDIKQVIERFQNFIDQNPGTPAADRAKSEMQVWQERQAKGLVKAGDKWVTPDQRNAMHAQVMRDAIRIHDLMKQNHLKDAGAELDKAIAAEPQNPTLLYLRGVLQYQQEKLALARKSFEPVATALPDHAPTLNNMAVVLWRQKAISGALTFFDRALLAAPDSREIIDNVLEVLNVLTPEQQKLPGAQKLARHFRERNDAMEKQMAQNGQYRWGSTWVDEKTHKEIQEKQKTAKDEMDKLDVQYKGDEQQVALMERKIAALQEEMNILQAQTYQQSPDGKTVQLPLSPLYYQYAQEQAATRAQEALMQNEMQKLRGQFKEAQKKMPIPPFSGIQRIVDADGMPLPAPPPNAAPATKPADLQFGQPH